MTVYETPNEPTDPDQHRAFFYAELRHPGVLGIRFHSFSDGEVIG